MIRLGFLPLTSSRETRPGFSQIPGKLLQDEELGVEIFYAGDDFTQAGFVDPLLFIAPLKKRVTLGQFRKLPVAYQRDIDQIVDPALGFPGVAVVLDRKCVV